MTGQMDGDGLLARLSGVPVALGPPKTGDHVRFALTHQVGDQAPVGYRSGETLCGVRVRLDDPVTDGPLTCSTCIRSRALLERVRTLRETQQFRQFSEGGWIRPAIIPTPAADAAPQHTLGTPADWVREGEERAIREWAEEGQW